MQLPDNFYPVMPNLKWVQIVAESGARFIQIRLKDIDDDEKDLELMNAISYSHQKGFNLVINDYWEEAMTLKAEWLHLGQEDLETADMKAIKKAGIKLGISTHNLEELDNAMQYSPDYIALGPIYFTRLKSMKFAPQGLDEIKLWKQKIDNIPLVAIGGLNLDRAKLAFDVGADCVSVVTDITLHQNPQQHINDWLHLCSDYK
jgi:thiamine-phosphate pyrophosphorylase